MCSIGVRFVKCYPDSEIIRCGENIFVFRKIDVPNHCPLREINNYAIWMQHVYIMYTDTHIYLHIIQVL